MKRLLRSSVLLAACVGFWSCTNDPTGDLGGTPTKLAATPSSLFIDKGATELVDIEVLDEQGAAVPSTFSVTSLDPGVDVTVDDEFRPEYGKDGVLFVPDEVTKLRLNVTAVELVETTIHVTAGDLSTDIVVRVLPPLLEATFSELNPGLGDTITMTAPAGVLFTPNPASANDTSKVTFGTAVAPVIVERDPNGTFIKMIVAPNSDAPATVTNLMLDYTAEDLRFTRNTDETVTAPQFEFLPATLSLTDPRIGDTVTITSTDPILKIRSAATVSWPGGRAAIVTGWASDSTAISVLPQPGSSGPPTINGIIVEGAAPQAQQFRITLQADVGADTLSLANQDITLYTGSDDPATAPTITLPTGLGNRVGWYDLPSTSPQFYKFVVGVETTFKTTISWEVPSADIDVAWYTGAGAFLGYFGAGTGARPEVSTHTFAPGTYLIGPEIYDGDPGGWYQFTIEVVPAP